MKAEVQATLKTQKPQQLAFSNKVSREVALKEVLVLKGVVQLAVGHAAALKPAVKDLLHPPQHPFALLAGNGDVVDEVPVQICHLHKAAH